MPNCASITKPLCELMTDQKKVDVGQVQEVPEHLPETYTPVDWTNNCVKPFEQLKTMIFNCVVPAHPHFDQPFVLSIDASLDGLGAVLSQVPKGESRVRPVAIASKMLNASQRRFPTHRLKVLTLKWSVCEKFSYWLKKRSFTVWTDNNPLTYLLTKPKLDECKVRWVSKIASFSFDLAK